MEPKKPIKTNQGYPHFDQHGHIVIGLKSFMTPNWCDYIVVNGTKEQAMSERQKRIDKMKQARYNDHRC